MKSKQSVIVLVLTFVVVALANSLVTAGTDIQTSEAVKTILRQTEQAFVKPGASINQVAHNDPIMFATFVGLTMQRQNIYLNKRRDADDLKRMTALGSEIMAMLANVAKILEYKNPADGSPMSAEELRSTFLHAFSGDYNQMFLAQGFDPTTMNVPYMISQVPLPPQSPGEGVADGGHGHLQVKKPNGISLLGESPPAAESNTTAPYVGTPHPPEPAPISETCLCSKMNPGRKGEYTRNFPLSLTCRSGGYTTCGYFDDGRLATQYQHLTGERDKWVGVQLDYEISRGKYYLREKYFGDINGERHGVQEGNSITDSGQVYLSSWGMNEHGQLIETKGFIMHPKSGYFMNSHYRYSPAKGIMESVKR